MSKIHSLTIELQQNGVIREITDSISAFTIKDSILTGMVEYYLEFLTEKANSEELLMFSNDAAITLLRISYWRNEIEVTSGWKRLYIIGSRLCYGGAYSLVKVKAASATVRLKKHEKWKAHISKSPNFIFSSIAAENGLVYKTVEEGYNQADTWYQLAETDWNFLKSVCREMMPLTGQRFTYPYIDDNTLQVGPLYLNKPPIRSYGIGTADDRAISIEYAWHGKEVDWMGGGVRIAKGFDILNKEFLESTLDTSLLPSMSKFLGSPLTESTQFHYYTEQSLPILRNEALMDWIQTASKYFSARATLVGDIRLKPGDIVQLRVSDPGGNTSSMNGKYPVYEVCHTYRAVEVYEDGKKLPEMSITTHLGGFRRTFEYGGTDTPDGINLSTIRSIDRYTKNKPTEVEQLVQVAKELD